MMAKNIPLPLREVQYHQERAAITNRHNLGTVKAQETQIVIDDRPSIH
jgi:hypothetical protein